ncbi:12803_t:CDS:2 [Ambispora gerdemannii]|uniref:GrpE protein homolog, mitochondrial n=1 Tax=Ambispora gerdemannii TaxID=144530 RepID=A0A9N9DA26_9GLOM|nr:12803_t:CDS:2 [Ambispora gerdemannii]
MSKEVKKKPNNSPKSSRDLTNSRTGEQKEVKPKLPEQERNLRLLADLDNQKKSYLKEINELVKYSNERLLQRLLFFPDNYERALQVSQNEKDPKIQNFLTGFRMVLTEFQNILKKEGVEEIKITLCQDVYDDKLHHALEVEENNDYPEGTILQVFQKGYQIHQRVLRPAEVKISKPKEAEKERKE